MSKAIIKTAASDNEKAKFEFGWHDRIPGELADDGFYIGIRSRRVFAYLIDIVVVSLFIALFWLLGSILTVVTLGFILPVLVAISGILPLAYHTFTVGGPQAATFGMRTFGLRAYSVDGMRPNYIQALVAAFVFYLTVSWSFFLVLLVALFNRRGRLVHDYLSGLVIARRENPDAD